MTAEFVTKAKGEIMRFEADTHSHTLASGHAYSTIKEMAAAAEAWFGGMQLTKMI